MEYYIVLNGVKEGPFSLEELKAKGVTESTLVWKNGLTDWVKANTLPEVMQAIYTAPAPQPVPEAPVAPAPQPTPQPAPAPQYQQPAQPAPQPQPAPQYQQPAQPRPAAAQAKPQAAPAGPAPDDYQQKNLILAIVSFLCCGMIGGILAVLGYMAGGEVKKYWLLGQTEMAEKKAADAKKWFKIAIIVDVVLAVLIGGIYALNIVLAMMN